MSLMTRLASLLLGLPPAVTHKIEYQIDLPVPMADGTILLANRIAPVGGEKLPIILIRNPYTARGKKPDFISLLIAERGYQVVVQNCRGTWGSGGVFQPFLDDREDGLATFKWLAEQPWFSGSVGMYGLSYWGYAQLSAGAGAPDFVKALVPQMAASRIYGVMYDHGILSLDVALTWNYQTYVSNAQESDKEKARANKQRKSALARGFMHLPVGGADQSALNLTSPFFQDLLRYHQPNDKFWATIDHSKQVDQIEAPVHFIEGWYDFFLADALTDYASLCKAGKKPYLTIGPWTHADTGGLKAGFKESFIWYDAYLRGNRAALRPDPVQVFVMGIKKWVNLPAWPPPSASTSLYLQSGGKLSTQAPAAQGGEAKPSHYQYDPADPTPSVGGSVLFDGGPKDNRALEARADVLTFTSDAMTHNTTIMGAVSVDLYVRSTNEHTDFFARLCDVSPNGKKSINICDGIIRLTPQSQPVDKDGVRKVTIVLLSTAHCFKTGHRIRLQVSSGAHPRYARNLGTGEPISTGTMLRKADQEIFHDHTHCSALMLPVIQTPI